jgi:hypothetical protein
MSHVSLASRSAVSANGSTFRATRAQPRHTRAFAAPPPDASGVHGHRLSARSYRFLLANAETLPAAPFGVSPVSDMHDAPWFSFVC